MKKTRFYLIALNKILHEGQKTKGLVVYLSLILLFVISVSYFYWFGDGVFIYQENQSLFIFSGEYLQKYIIKPGGLLEYAGNLLTQGYFNSVYGSFIISSLLILVCIVFIQINRRLSADRSFSLLLILLPSCFLLLMQTRYVYFMHHNLGYLLLALYFSASIVPKGISSRFLVLALFPVFFYMTGSFALIYPVMYIIYSIIYEKGLLRYLLPTFLVIIAFITFIIFKEVLFLQPVDQMLHYPLTFTSYIDLFKHHSFLYMLCGYIVLFPLLVKISGILKVNKKYAGFIHLATLLTVFPITVFLISKNYDPILANLFQLEKSVYKQDWDSIIKQQESSPTTNLIGQYYYNLALSEKGQLCDRLFFGHQDFGTKSLTLPHDLEFIDKYVYFYYTIGLISEAHHLAYESMVIYGYRPENIKLLIKTELINGNYKIANRYINVLKKTLHYRSWAEKYGKMLYDPKLINSDPELGEKIQLLPKIDFYIRSNDVENIEVILIANPDNKIAFEYKIARMLLEKNLRGVVNEVKKMKEMGYNNIPRHIEEAIVAFMDITKEFPDLGGLTIKPKTVMRFKYYDKVYRLNRGYKSLLEKEMKKEGGQTLWYYLQFK